MKRILVVLAATTALAIPAPAAAQFTAAIPKAKPVEVAQPVLEIERQREDSVARVTVQGLQEWVDSAAIALTGEPPDTVEFGELEPAGAAVIEERPAAGEVVAFEEGAPAPDTATPLPLLALIGGGLVAAGGLLLRRRRD